MNMDNQWLDPESRYYWNHVWTPDLLGLLRADAAVTLQAAVWATPHTGLRNTELGADRLELLKQVIMQYCLETGETVPSQLRDELAAHNAAGPPRPRARVRVTVRRNPDYPDWTISIMLDGRAQSLPTTRKLRPYIPAQYRAGLRWTGASYRSENSIKECLEAGSLPAQVLADAIKAHYLATLERATSAESEGDPAEAASLARMQPAILAVGGLSYRLVPTGAADMRAPLRAIRKQAREVAQAEAIALTANATRDAQNIVQSAEQRARDIRREIDLLRAQQARVLPEWLAGSGRWIMPDASNNTNWLVRLRITLRIESIQMTVARWNRILTWDSLPLAASEQAQLLSLTVSIGPAGAYTFRHIRCMEPHTHSPHITDSCCMELQARPTVLDSERKLRELESALSRGMLVVNMNSLLGRHVADYHPLIAKQLPECIREMIAHNRQWPTEAACARRAYPAESVSWQREISLEEEAGLVFHTGQMPPELAIAEEHGYEATVEEPVAEED